MTVRLVTAAEMRAIEVCSADEYGLSGEILMENAARAAVRFLMHRRGPGPARTAVFCGKGNNGGDGWAVARILKEAGWDVTVYHPGLDVTLPFEAELNRKRALDMGLPMAVWEDCFADLDRWDLIIDALLGTGIQREVTGELLQLIQAINGSGLPVLSLDIPSGIMSDTGQVAGEAIRARWTVAFGLKKLGEAVYPGNEYVGEIWVDPIGIHQKLLNEEGQFHEIEGAYVASRLPRRPMDTHKGKNGHLLVMGGSEGMTGAISLSGLAALRMGAGLVTMGKRPELVIYEKPMEIMSLPWTALQISDYDAAVFGPGLSMAEDGRRVLERVLAAETTPRVIDADGLNLLSMIFRENKVFRFSGPVVLTPHPGEMARLCQRDTTQVQAARISLATEKAAEWNAVVVLKGARTVVGTPQGRVWINTTGNPGMATAGTGDVLTGVIGALLAQGLSPEDAAVAGVYIHGAAGDLAAAELGEVGIMASDLANRLPRVVRSVKQGVSIR